MDSLFSLEGAKALVTGGNRGLGQGMAVALARAGADVAASSYESCDETADIVRGLGRKAWVFTADHSDRADIRRLVEEANAEMGRVDILVNNAGIILRHPAAEFPEDAWDRVLEINLSSVFFLCQAFGRDMVERGRGKIINVASLLSFSGGILVPSYTASKHGVAGITKALANEWAKNNVQVNAIAPGYMATDNTQALRDDPVRSKEILARIPAGRWGTPEDVGSVAVFLASRASDYVNGHVLTVDGGWMAR